LKHAIVVSAYTRAIEMSSMYTLGYLTRGSSD
jgi:hypothetical protein